MATDLDARSVLESLVGQQISTLTGRPNTVLDLADANVRADTDRSTANSYPSMAYRRPLTDCQRQARSKSRPRLQRRSADQAGGTADYPVDGLRLVPMLVGRTSMCGEDFDDHVTRDRPEDHTAVHVEAVGLTNRPCTYDIRQACQAAGQTTADRSTSAPGLRHIRRQ
jgi:hypothetical protein